MGNQITFSPKEKEKTLSSADGELEMENIQLKNTNRKLISKLDQQKQLIKKLNNELESIKMSVELNDANRLKRKNQTLKNKNENLETLLIQSKKEIAKLKKEVSKLNKDSEESESTSRWNKLKNIRK
jgi:predicted RNase H-like nuclease (RuvC/YqgF family)